MTAPDSFVFLNYDQAAFDAAYNQSAYAPHSEHVRRRIALASEDTRSRLEPYCVSYGNTEVERLDWYITRKPKAPVLIFIHGGARR